MKTHKLRINGKEVSRKEFFRRRRTGGGGVPMTTHTYNSENPLVSESLGCLPHQVPEMRQIIEREGLTGVNVRDDGAVEFTSRGDTGRRGLMKLRACHDNDGCYGDG